MQAAAEAFGRGAAPGSFGGRGKLTRFDLHREGAEAHPASVDMQPATRQACGAGKPVGGFGKILDVILSLEADQVGGDEIADQRTRLGHARQHIGGRKRDVEEETNRRGNATGAQHRRHGHQVIVVDPQQIVRTQHRRQAGRHLLVDRAVDLGVAPVERHKLRHRVKQRP